MNRVHNHCHKNRYLLVLHWCHQLKYSVLPLVAGIDWSASENAIEFMHQGSCIDAINWSTAYYPLWLELMPSTEVQCTTPCGWNWLKRLWECNRIHASGILHWCHQLKYSVLPLVAGTDWSASENATEFMHQGSRVLRFWDWMLTRSPASVVPAWRIKFNRSKNNCKVCFP
jgi:hypothetical protein